MINRVNGKTIEDTELVYSNVATTTGAKNSKVTVTAKPDSTKYKGTVDVNYDRLDLTTDIADVYLAIPDNTLSLNPNSYKKIADVVVTLNERLGVNLTSDDYTDGDVPPYVDTPIDVTVTAKPGSLCYIGSLTVTIKPDLIELSTVITNLDLDGLTYVPREAPSPT
jgi:hypothetical protein